MPRSRKLARAIIALVAPSAAHALAGRFAAALTSQLFGPLAVALCLGLTLHIPYGEPASLGVSVLLTAQALWSTRGARFDSRGRRGVLAGVLVCTYWPLVLVSAFAVSPLELYTVPSTSMEPTLWPGDFLVMDSWAYTRVVPERGDVVIFTAPVEQPVEYVKRVVGLPGDALAVRAHRVWLSGRPLPEPHVQVLPPDPTRAELPNVGPLTVPPGHVYVLGDNRTRSVDSRNFGAVPFPVVRGRVLWVLWPFSRSRALGALGRGAVAW